MTHIEVTNVELLDGTVTLVELCSYTQLPPQHVLEMIEMGLIEPLNPIDSSGVGDHYRFAVRELRRVRVAGRLMRDLGVNLDGVATIMNLLEERDDLINRVNMLEKLLER
jgi:chaperone modulatory protein CbpM